MTAHQEALKKELERLRKKNISGTEPREDGQQQRHQCTTTTGCRH